MYRQIACVALALAVFLGSVQVGHTQDASVPPRPQARDAEELIHRLEVSMKRSSPQQEDTARQLVAMGRSAVPALIEAQKRRPNYRLATILGEIGDPRAVEPLVAAMKRDRNGASEAAVALPKLGPPAVEPLIALLGDCNRFVRRDAALALGTLRDSRAVTSLLNALHDRHFSVREAAATALGKLRDRRAVEPLLAMLNSGRGVEATARALGQIGDRRGLGPLLAMAADKKADSWQRAAIFSTLGLLGDVKAIDPLVAALDDPNEDRQIRSAAAVAAGKIGGPRALKALIAALASSAERTPAAAPNPGAGCPAPDPFPGAVVAGLTAIGPPAVEPLIRLLQNGCSDAAVALGEIRDPRAVKPLVAAMEGPQCNHFAAQSLVQIGSPAVEPLIAVLENPSFTVRWGAAYALGQLKDRRATDPLWRLFQDPRNERATARVEAKKFLIAIHDPRLFDWAMSVLAGRQKELRWEAIDALGEYRDPRAVGPLTAALKQGDKPLRLLAIAAIEKIGQAEAANALAGLVDDPDQEVVARAALGLASLGDTRAVPALIAAVRAAGESRERPVYEKALTGLGPKAVESLIAALGDSDLMVRCAAATTLGQIGDRRAVEPLIVALRKKDEHWWVRLRTADALGDLGDARAIGPLIEVLDNDQLSHYARNALWALGRPAVEPLCAALRHENTKVRSRAADALVGIADQRAVAPLIEALQDPALMYSAVLALGETGDPRAARPLAATLGSKGVTGTALLEMLPKMGVAAVEPTLAALNNADSAVRSSAAFVLGELGDPRAVEPLLGALTDRDNWVRGNVAEALGRLGDDRAVDPLIQMLQDEDLRVRQYAIAALGEIGHRRGAEALRARLKSEKDASVRYSLTSALSDLP